MKKKNLHFHLHETCARYAKVIGQNYRGYGGEFCQTFLACIKFLTLIVLEIYGTQLSGFTENVKNFTCFNILYDRYVQSITLNSVHLVIFISRPV